MSLCRYVFLRRRSAYKLMLLALIAYIMYLSVAVFGKLNSSVQLETVDLDELRNLKIDPMPFAEGVNANFPRELPHPVNRRADNNDYVNRRKSEDSKNAVGGKPVIAAADDEFDSQERLRRARRIIEQKDNVKNYDRIKKNGAMAKGLTIDTKKLGVKEKELFDEGWSKYAFNEYASTLIPINRTLPDIRLAGYKASTSIVC
jgi:hypothetical protein